MKNIAKTQKNLNEMEMKTRLSVLSREELSSRCMFLNSVECVMVRGIAYSDVGDRWQEFIGGLAVGERFTLCCRRDVVFGRVYDVVYDGDMTVGRVAFHHCGKVAGVADARGRAKATFVFADDRHIFLRLDKTGDVSQAVVAPQPLLSDMQLISSSLLLTTIPADTRMRNIALEILDEDNRRRMLPLIEKFSRVCCQSIAYDDVQLHIEVIRRIREVIVSIIDDGEDDGNEDMLQRFIYWCGRLRQLFCTMTEGSNLHDVFSQQLQRIEQQAIKDGVIDAFWSQEFKNKTVGEKRLREVKTAVKEALNGVLNGCYYMKDSSVMANKLYYGGATREDIYKIGTYIAIHKALKRAVAEMKISRGSSGGGGRDFNDEDSQRLHDEFVKKMRLIVKKDSWQCLDELFADIMELTEENDVPKTVQRFISEGKLKFIRSNGRYKPCSQVMSDLGFYTKSRWNDHLLT